MKNKWKPLLLVAYVFLFVGSIICMNDLLLPALKDFFKLTYVEASMVQQSFYLVYLIFPVPIAFYIAKYGYKTALITALIVCGLGGAIFIPAYYSLSLVLALTAVFIISLGVTVVNVAANPMAALLGDPSGSHVRVNFVQLFSRIGFSFTPIIATRLIYSGDGDITFHVPYMLLGAGTLIFAVFIFFSALPSLKPAVEKGFNVISIIKESRHHPRLFLGVVAMFFEMGAEACTPGFFTNYLREVSGFSTDETATYLTYYYIATTIVCVIGIFLLQIFRPGRLVAFFGVGMIAMYLLAIFTKSELNPYYLLGMGAFISIIFPSIFSLALEGLGQFTEKGSALINMSFVGGAAFPPLQGLIADSEGVQFSYIVPCLCFVVVVLYGIYCDRRVQSSGVV